MTNKTLDERCLELGGFVVELAGNLYCSLAYSRKIQCDYLSKERDQNYLYTCNHPLLIPIDLQSYKEMH
jgi:hypothetical protein